MDKDLVFVASGGRTGTKFMGMHLSSMIEGSFSVHEPDINFGLFNRLTWENVRHFGIYHMLIGRLMGRTGARMIGKSLLTGKMSLAEATRRIRKSREKYVQRHPEQLIIEANGQWSYVLPALRAAFPESKIVCIARSEATWVRSWVRKGDRYTEKDTAGGTRINPALLGKISEGEWNACSVEQKLKWEWNFIDNLLRDFSAQDTSGNTRLFEFEDLFFDDDRETHFAGLLAFISQFGDRKYAVNFDSALLDQRENATTA
ncbi:hypothetical protein [Sphingorhabdus sp.]|uniref:hypothetical protein n=1 Tax=Sphingorhabdus sp. TaxID=1902408 RepID=UPI0035B1464B